MPQMTVHAPDIPEYLRDGMSYAQAVASFIELADGLPVPFDGATRPVRVEIAADTLRYLCPDKPNPVVIGQYVNAVLMKRQMESGTPPSDADRSLYQQMFYNGIASEMNKNKIILAEGATGIGKGRVLARIAKEQSDAGNTVVVAAPSVAVLKQLIEEWCKSGYPVAQVSCLLGRQQFVDNEALFTLITSKETGVAELLGESCINTIVEWMKDGCPSIKGNADTAAIRVVAPMISCLDSDLQYLCPDLEPYAQYYLINSKTSKGDPGMRAYDLLRESVKEDATVIFCTHTMVALDRKLKILSGAFILPEYQVLLVDEAHLFERNMAGIYTNSLSMSSLRSAIKKTESGSKTARRACLVACVSVIKHSKNIDAPDCGDKTRIYYADMFVPDSGKLSPAETLMFESVSKLYTALNTLNTKSRKKDARLMPYMEALKKISAAVNCELYAQAVILNNTPVRSWPVFKTGKCSIKNELNKLWDGVETAVFVSATLSVPGTRGRVNNEYIHKILHIPPHRSHVAPAVCPTWVTGTPVLYLPSDERGDLIFDGKIEKREQREGWWNAITGEILSSTRTAMGGTLVLCCSYEDVTEIGKRLVPVLGSRVILKTRIASIEKQKQAFKISARHGNRPVWLAVGNAWTGLDLRDEKVDDSSPHLDLMLTDLIIPRINFSDNQTIIHALRNRQRKERMDYTEACFTLKQGLGRLIRRPGLTNRRIFFLDNRLSTKKGYNIFRQLLAAYSKQEIIN